MTWKHTGKVSAFNLVSLDFSTAQTQGILGFGKKDKSFKITQQALTMLGALNDFDQAQVLRDIQSICNNPTQPSSIKHSRNFLKRIYRNKIPFKSYHFLIEYNATNGVVIEDIMFDKRLTVEQFPVSRERSMMHHVTQNSNGMQYDKAKPKKEIDNFGAEWRSIPTSVARTQHISVNGMQNELAKARWLMGVHTQVAYQQDEVNQYTLFHNPSDGAGLDLVECIFDSTGGRQSHNAQQLAAIMAQQANKPTKWTVHSQGAIIFLAALKHFSRRYSQTLNGHKLAIHGSGASLSKIKRLANTMNIQIVGIRNNPFDAVPNSTALPVSLSGLMRTLKFLGLVVWGDEASSPHTLPYLGIETYQTQLRLLGQHDKAETVARYMRQQGV